MNIESIAGFAVITPAAASRSLYVDALGLPLEGEGYLHSESIDRAHHFGIWPFSPENVVVGTSFIPERHR